MKYCLEHHFRDKMQHFMTNANLENTLLIKTDLGHHFALLGKVCNSLQHPVSIQQGQQII